MIDRYIVRYRRTRTDGTTALIVEDAAGTAWLFEGGCLHSLLPRPTVDERATPAQLAARLGGTSRWFGVPEVAPYSLAGLQHLAYGATRPHRRHCPPTAVLDPTRPQGLARPTRTA